MIKSLTLSALMLGAFCMATTPAWSDTGRKRTSDEGHVADLVKGAKVTIDQAVKTALDEVPGTPVEAELEKKQDKTVWEVEVLGADGKLTEVHIDAVSGAIIDTKAKREKHSKKEK